MMEWLSKMLIKRTHLRYFLFSILTIFLTCAVAYASEAGGEESHTKTLIDFGWRLLNFAILVWFLYWVSAKGIKKFFFERRQNIKTNIEETTAEKEATEKKFNEYSAKLDKATEEINNIFEIIKAQGVAEKEKIIQDAKIAAEKMKEDAQSRMEQELKAARNLLRTEAAQLSVEMAEELLKKNITPEHHDFMVKDYLDKVVKKH
ncbi:MAG TPA: F0F1 ATP synthase subunit B [Syntrophales bacterium]|nr:F0F1 ATP synthase subunit B [Syntrophales bacterium]